MEIDLSKKGSRIDLRKHEPALKRARIELSWKPNETDTGFDFDLDGSVFILEERQVNGSTKNQLVSDRHMVFYGNQSDPEGAVITKKDNRNGRGEGPDEIIIIEFDKFPPNVVEASLIITIHDAIARGQNFGQVPTCGLKIFNDETGTLIASLDLEEDFSLETAVQVSSFYRKDGHMGNLKNISAGYNLGLDAFVIGYGAAVKE